MPPRSFDINGIGGEKEEGVTQFSIGQTHRSLLVVSDSPRTASGQNPLRPNTVTHTGGTGMSLVFCGVPPKAGQPYSEYSAVGNVEAGVPLLIPLISAIVAL